MLFEPDRHEPLQGSSAWDETRVHACVAAIASRAERERGADGQWPAHPLDLEGDAPRDGYKGLYLGSAGVLWALWWLQRQGAVTKPALDAAAGLAAAHAAYLERPDDSSEVVPSYYLGEVGILLLWWRLAGTSQLADRLHAAVQANIGNPTLEALWAAPGTMVAAWHLWRASGQVRWRKLFLDNVAQLWRTWAFDGAIGCHLWTQDLYGQRVQYLGAGHGFAGNVFPLLLGAELLDDARREALYERCEAVLGATARRDGDAVNWPPGTYAPRPGRPQMLMQWCHGAPGIVTALAAFPVGRSSTIDALLLGAGQAIWRAGPLTKGPGLCHGTAGNALAFLALHQRTGDEVWLQRARAFAMHAIGQYERMRERYGRDRHSLWTGDTGLAVVLWQCLTARAGLPALDFLE
jgi:Lanthionine synthetase C-like protein